MKPNDPQAPARTALLLIDLQANMLDPGNPVHGADSLIDRLSALRQRARAAGVPVVLVRNCGGDQDPDVRGTPGWELHRAFPPEPGDLVLDKTTCDTFASTPLDADLKQRGVTRVVITGLQSNWCIRESTQGALERGYEVTLVSDGHSTYDDKTKAATETSAEVNAEFEGRAALRRAEDVRFP